jgi:Domain of unknown function (DUF4157)
MRTLAIKQLNRAPVKEKKNGDKGRSACSSASLSPRHSSPLSTGMPLLQRKCACGGGCPRCQEQALLQTKLKISEPGDKYEQEADLIADQVMRMPEPSVQRQMETQEEEEEILQTKNKTSQVSTVTPSIHNGISRLRQSSGTALPTSTRAFLEPRFGHDFSHVKIHTSPQAADLSRSVNARAFTVGHNIFFNQGEFQPNTPFGMRLLAHELTHTLQQSSQVSRYQASEEVIQRFITCESSEDCPSREPGEIGRSRSEPMELFEMTSGGIGMLVSNFAVGASSIRGDLTTNSRWNSFVSGMGANPNMTWEILGFTDCQGNEALNTTLRTARATELYLNLPDNAMAQVDTYGGAALTDCIRNNASEENRRLNRSAIIRQKSVSYEFEPEIVEGSASRTVYMCSKPLDTSPIGNHAFFRFDSPAPGNDTLSLQPIQVIPAGDCWQGIPDWNYASDRSAQGSCNITAIRFRDLIREFNAYPIGHYCTWGPNSNTFVGHLARRTGIPNPDPPGTTPGIDDSPPPSGTYAPNKWVTLSGCETKICIPDAMGTDLETIG